MMKAVFHRATINNTVLTVLLQMLILFHFSPTTTTTTTRLLVNGQLLSNQQQRFPSFSFSSFIQNRIVGGNDVTNPNKYPYFIEWDVAGCGGTLIHEDLMLTAAHCYRKNALGSKVYIGSLRSKDNTGNRSYVREIINLTQHPDYDDWTWYADYMIVKLNTPIDSNVIKPVQLNRDHNYPPDNEVLSVIGFGDLWDGHDRGSNTLQETTVNHIPYTDCYDRYHRTNKGEINEALMICAGTNNGRDSCYGDSGGPLLNLNGTIQIGITSWGVGCADKKWPAVYSRVSGVIDWIDYQICQQATNPPLSCFEAEKTEEEEAEEEEEEQQKQEHQEEEKEDVEDVIDNNSTSSTTTIISETTTTTATTMVDNSDNSVAENIDSYSSSATTTTAVTMAMAPPPPSSSTILELPPNNSSNSSSNNNNNYISNDEINNIQLQIDILYDERPTETAWTLMYDKPDDGIGSIANNIAIEWSFFGDVTEPSKLVTTTIQDLEPGNYWFVIMDDANNGICCQHGEGYIKIIDVTNNIIIWDSIVDDFFGGSKVVSFELPPASNHNANLSSSSRIDYND